MEQDVLILDKDETLLDEYGLQVYPCAEDFLREQREHNRRLVVATVAVGWTTSREQPFRDLKDKYFDGVYGRESLCGSLMYMKEDGTIGRLSELSNDYAVAPGSENAKRLSLVHKKTGLPFDESKYYANPYGAKGLKDLYLLRKLLSPHSHDALRMVMVGNEADIAAAESDPATPLIVVEPWGYWLQRDNAKNLIETFLGSRPHKPHEVFDVFMAGAQIAETAKLQHSVREAVVKVMGQFFRFVRTGKNGRIVFEEPENVR